MSDSILLSLEIAEQLSCAVVVAVVVVVLLLVVVAAIIVVVVIIVVVAVVVALLGYFECDSSVAFDNHGNSCSHSGQSCDVMYTIRTLLQLPVHC